MTDVSLTLAKFDSLCRRYKNFNYKYKNIGTKHLVILGDFLDYLFISRSILFQQVTLIEINCLAIQTQLGFEP